MARVTIARDVVFAEVENWSPTGTAVLVSTSEFSGECRYQDHWRDTLYVITLGKHPSVRRLVTYDSIGHADWSPNGRLIALTQGIGDQCGLEVIEPTGRHVRTVASFDYVPYGCFNDGLTTRWAPSSEHIVFSNGTTVFRAKARAGTPRELYRAQPARQSCDASTDCPSLEVLDVANTGNVLARAEPLQTATMLWLIQPSGKATQLPERPRETVLRFAPESERRHRDQESLNTRLARVRRLESRPPRVSTPLTSPQ